MIHRSAPFVAPTLPSCGLPADASPELLGEASPSTTNDKAQKKQIKQLLSTLQADIAQFRYDFFPPPLLTQVQELPIFYGNLAEVQSYEATWQPLVTRAKGFYPSAGLPPDYLPLPASLEIPQFMYHVQKLHLTRTKAKESKSFGSVGALIAKCGDYEPEQVAAMTQVLAVNAEARLVAHREFFDLRAYVFCRDAKGSLLEPQRMRFYRTGLIIHALEGFHVVDSRQTPRKKRNDAYKDPIAHNGVWKVFVKT